MVDSFKLEMLTGGKADVSYLCWKERALLALVRQLDEASIRVVRDLAELIRMTIACGASWQDVPES